MIGLPAVYSYDFELLSLLGITNLLRYSNRLGGLGIPKNHVYQLFETFVTHC